MGKIFTVEVRTSCKICKDPLPNKRWRTYCSKTCRKVRDSHVYKKYRADYQRRMQDKKAEEQDSNKEQCGMCGRFYVNLCLHVYSRHGVTAREYKEHMGFDVSKGLIPAWLKEIKREHVFENGTVLNLKKGKHTRYRIGDPRAGNYIRSEETMKRLKNNSGRLKKYVGKTL